MLHYNVDFTYFATHLLQRTMGITLLTEVPIWMPMTDKVMLDLIMTKAMSCHGKDVTLLQWQQQSLCQTLIDSWMFSGLREVLAVSLETNMYKIGFMDG